LEEDVVGLDFDVHRVSRLHLQRFRLLGPHVHLRGPVGGVPLHVRQIDFAYANKQPFMGAARSPEAFAVAAVEAERL
jgi:hypothetical protein